MPYIDRERTITAERSEATICYHHLNEKCGCPDKTSEGRVRELKNSYENRTEENRRNDDFILGYELDPNVTCIVDMFETLIVYWNGLN